MSRTKSETDCGSQSAACVSSHTGNVDRGKEGRAATHFNKKPLMGSVAKYGLMTCASLVYS